MVFLILERKTMQQIRSFAASILAPCSFDNSGNHTPKLDTYMIIQRERHEHHHHYLTYSWGIFLELTKFLIKILKLAWNSREKITSKILTNEEFDRYSSVIHGITKHVCQFSIKNSFFTYPKMIFLFVYYTRL